MVKLHSKLSAYIEADVPQLPAKIKAAYQVAERFRETVYGVNNKQYNVPCEPYDKFFNQASYQRKSRLSFAASRLAQLPLNVQLKVLGCKTSDNQITLDIRDIYYVFDLTAQLRRFNKKLKGEWTRVRNLKRYQPFRYHIEAMLSIPWEDVAMMAHVYAYSAIQTSLASLRQTLANHTPTYDVYASIAPSLDALLEQVDALAMHIKQADIEYVTLHHPSEVKDTALLNEMCNRLALARRGIPRFVHEIGNLEPDFERAAHRAAYDISAQYALFNDMCQAIGISLDTSLKTAHHRTLIRQAVLSELSMPKYGTAMLDVYAVEDKREVTLHIPGVCLTIPFESVQNSALVGNCVQVLSDFVYNNPLKSGESRSPSAVVRHITTMLSTFPSIKQAKRYIELDKQFSALLNTSLLNQAGKAKPIKLAWVPEYKFKLPIVHPNITLTLEYTSEGDEAFCHKLTYLITSLAEAVQMDIEHPQLQPILAFLSDLQSVLAVTQSGEEEEAEQAFQDLKDLYAECVPVQQYLAQW